MPWASKAQQREGDPSSYPYLRGAPKYGFRDCLQCGASIELRIARDVPRKRYCSDSCRLAHRLAGLQEAANRAYETRRDTPTKQCRRCLKTFPKNRDFFCFTKRENGHDTCSAYCRLCHSEISKENKIKNWGTGRNRHLIARYNITEQQFLEMVAAQGDVCPICRIRRPVAVDHDHQTGEIRGILCNGCNTSIGVFREDADIFSRAMDYLGIEIVPVIKAE